VMVARVRAASVSLVLLFGATGAGAQPAPESRLAEGRVLRAADDGRPAPVASQWVVLHRVGSDRSAPLDSARTDRAGRYRIRYERSGDPEALYFVSSRYDGIAYFSAPLRQTTVRGGDADVMVFATTSDTTALRVQGRHLVISAPRGVRREIAEIFEIENTGYRTIVARDSTTPAWYTMISAQAESASVAPGDLSTGAVAFRGGRAQVYAPISPGVRQIALTYLLPGDAFPLSLPMGRPVSVLEVLLEEPRAIVEGAGLSEVAPAAIDGRTFRRFLAQNVPPQAVMRVTAPPPIEQDLKALRWLAFGSAMVMLLAMTLWVMRRRKSAPISHSPRPLRGHPSISAVDLLLAELATLDARFESTPPATADARATYERERSVLKERIERALAAEKASV
jgi:hypothetical protein